MLPKKSEKTILLFILINFSILGIVGYAIEKYRSPHSVLFITPAGAVTFNHTLHNTNGAKELECDSCHCVIQKADGAVATGNQKNCRQCHYDKKLQPSPCESALTHKRCVGAKCVGCHDDKVNECDFCHYR